MRQNKKIYVYVHLCNYLCNNGYQKKLAKGKIEGKESLRGKPIKRGKCQFLLDLIFPPLEEVSLSNTQKQFFNHLISIQLQNIHLHYHKMVQKSLLGRKSYLLGQPHRQPVLKSIIINMLRNREKM